MAGSEMRSEGVRATLLSGGGTTSRLHTAVRIDPCYEGPVVHVLDASRAVGVASALLSDDARILFLTGVRAEYDELRARRSERQSVVRRQSIADARANKLVLDLS